MSNANNIVNLSVDADGASGANGSGTEGETGEGTNDGTGDDVPIATDGRPVEDINNIPVTKPYSIWSTLLLYLLGACVTCTCLVTCLGVVHDEGEWDDEPEFLKPARNDDGYQRWSGNPGDEERQENQAVNIRDQRSAALLERV